jgi:hypothetical protein
VVDALLRLHAGNVVHFDLKLQNIFLEPLSDVREDHFWNPPTDRPPFRVILGDFGESKMWPGDNLMHTTRPRGTDFMKSPEMLCNGHLVLNRGRENFDRRKHSGASMPSDIWSLGCLLYQLVFGEMLFFDPDYMRFLQRITFGTGQMYPPIAGANLQATPVVDRMLRQLIMRDPEKRQTIEKVQGKLAQLLEHGRLDGEHVALPTYMPAPPSALAAINSDTVSPADALSASVAPRNSAALSSVLVPLSATAVPDASAVMRAGAPPAYGARAEMVLQLCTGVLFAPKSVCTVAELAAEAPRCVVVVTAGPGSGAAAAGDRSKERWLRLAAALEAPCVYIEQLRVASDESVAMLRLLGDRVSVHDVVLVAYEEGLWQEGATVALSLMMARQKMPCAHALLRLKRCSMYSSLTRESVALAQSSVC